MKQEYAEKTNLEVIDYSIDYSDDLDESDPTDIITTSNWSVSGDLVIDDGTVFDSTSTTVWVSGGGRNGSVSRLTNIASTIGGRTFVRQLMVKMVNKLVFIEDEEVIIPTS